LVDTLQKYEKSFDEIAEKQSTNVVFKSEAMYALQALTKNEFLAKTATSNVNSLRDAIINIASIGLSLNPALQFAYLVPRDKAVCLDISYKGLIKLATDTGSMLWVRADLVYEEDDFTYNGPAEKPTHKAAVFKERGEVVGGYCVAKTIEGDYLVEIMTISEIEQVRDSSQYYKAKKKGPWKDWFGEMAKKTLIKRASKTWPRSDKTDKLQEAIAVLNEHEGLAQENFIDISFITEEQSVKIQAYIEENGVDKEKFLKFVGTDMIDHIPARDHDRAWTALNAMPRKEDDNS